MVGNRAGLGAGRSLPANAGASGDASATDTSDEISGRDRIQSGVVQPDCALSACAPIDPSRSDALNDRFASATRESNVRAVARALCREWGDDPDEKIPVCDRSGRPTGRSTPKWTMFRSEAVAAITALVLAEGETDELLEIPAFLSAAARQTG
jgi:hypothetical protein